MTWIAIRSGVMESLAAFPTTTSCLGSVLAGQCRFAEDQSEICRPVGRHLRSLHLRFTVPPSLCGLPCRAVSVPAAGNVQPTASLNVMAGVLYLGVFGAQGPP